MNEIYFEEIDNRNDSRFEIVLRSSKESWFDYNETNEWKLVRGINLMIYEPVPEIESSIGF